MGELIFIPAAKTDDEIIKSYTRYFHFINNKIIREKSLVIFDAIIEPDWSFFVRKISREIEKKNITDLIPIFIVNDHPPKKYSVLFFKIPRRISKLMDEIQLYSKLSKREILVNYLYYVILKKSHGGLSNEADEFLDIISKDLEINIKNNECYGLFNKFALMSEKLSGSVPGDMKEILDLVKKVVRLSIKPGEVNKLRECFNNLIKAGRDEIWKETYL